MREIAHESFISSRANSHVMLSMVRRSFNTWLESRDIEYFFKRIKQIEHIFSYYTFILIGSAWISVIALIMDFYVAVFNIILISTISVTVVLMAILAFFELSKDVKARLSFRKQRDMLIDRTIDRVKHETAEFILSTRNIDYDWNRYEYWNDPHITKGERMEWWNHWKVYPRKFFQPPGKHAVLSKPLVLKIAVISALVSGVATGVTILAAILIKIFPEALDERPVEDAWILWPFAAVLATFICGAYMYAKWLDKNSKLRGYKAKRMMVAMGYSRADDELKEYGIDWSFRCPIHNIIKDAKEELHEFI